MKPLHQAALACVLLAISVAAAADDAPEKSAKPEVAKQDEPKPKKLEAKQSETDGSVTIGGKRIDYRAVAGTLLLDDKKDQPTASIFYAAYFKKD
ncbi:MAG TPA: peptidase S10, partial [Dokdonella sp.]